MKRLDLIWVVVDKLTKSAHFIPRKSNWTIEYLAKLYIEDIVRDPLFTSHFWETSQRALGTNIKLSTAYHPKTYGQTKWTVQVLEDLCACILDWDEKWEQQINLVKFTYNNSYQASIRMTPFDALYGSPCRSPLCWLKAANNVNVGPDMVREAAEIVKINQN